MLLTQVGRKGLPRKKDIHTIHTFLHTGFGSEGLDWEYEDNDAEDISEDNGKEEVF